MQVTKKTQLAQAIMKSNQFQRSLMVQQNGSFQSNLIKKSKQFFRKKEGKIQVLDIISLN